MAKETMKSKIERLEKENLELRFQIEELEKKYILEINKCKTECVKLKTKLKEIKEKASRAGRKKSLEANEIKEIKKLRSEGMTVKAIAQKLNTSMSTVNRVLKSYGGNENMDNDKNEEFGRLGYNGHNDRYGILNRMDLWEDEGLNCGTGLDIVIDDEIIHTRIEMKGKNTWYLVDTGLEGEELEGIKVVIK